MHPFLHTEVGKDRLHDPEPSGIETLALFTIDLGLPLIDQVWLLALHLKGKIPAGCIRLAQTACPQWTGGTVFDACMVDIISSMAVCLIVGMAGQFFSVRTELNLFGRVEREVRHGQALWLGP